ncbi:MAG: YetF domain-containing protein [Acidimicrobiia bacterium]
MTFGLDVGMWFEGWDPILRTAILGTIGYIVLILILRISGKRTLSKMNAFDFVITIALGSAFASLLVSPSISLAQGVAALVVLVGLQWIVSSLYVRSRWVESVVKGSPQLLYWRGEYLGRALKRERVTREEVQAAMRDSNVTDHRKAAAVIETDGSITVIDVKEQSTTIALEHVRRT